MSVERLYAETMSGAGAIGGVGFVSALLLLLLAFVLLPRTSRRELRLPVGLFGLHIVLVVLVSVLPAEAPPLRWARFLALLTLLMSMGKSGVLLLVDSVLVRRLSRPVPRIFRDILRSLVDVGVLLVSLQAAGVEPSSILTTSALITAVVGLSLQETLGNMFSGLALQAQRPFEVGDWIQFQEDERLAGQVLEVNWRSTKILTDEALTIDVPNGTLAKAPIRNFSQPTPEARRSVRLRAGLDVPPDRVRAVVMDALVGVPGVCAKPEPVVICDAFGESSMSYWVRFWTDDFAERYLVDGRVRERIWYALERAGIPIPFPTRESWVNDRNDARARVGAEQRDLARYLTALERVDLFQTLPAESLAELALRIRARPYGPRELILREDDPGAELFIVESGEVEVFVRGEGGRERVVAQLGTGAFFGEMSLMTGERRRASVRATRGCILVVVDRDAFHTILADSPELAEQISRVLARRREELDASSAGAGAEADLERRSSDLLHRIRRFFALEDRS